MPFHDILPLLSWLLMLVSIVILVRWFAVRGANRGESSKPLRGLDVLEQRYARGEIERDEYLQKKGDLNA